MPTRPTHILSATDITDLNFPAQWRTWTDQMRAEMKETVAIRRRTIDESKAGLITTRLTGRG
jgi:hypothetical protein